MSDGVAHHLLTFCSHRPWTKLETKKALLLQIVHHHVVTYTHQLPITPHDVPAEKATKVRAYYGDSYVSLVITGAVAASDRRPDNNARESLTLCCCCFSKPTEDVHSIYKGYLFLPSVKRIRAKGRLPRTLLVLFNATMFMHQTHFWSHKLLSTITVTDDLRFCYALVHVTWRK